MVESEISVKRQFRIGRKDESTGFNEEETVEVGYIIRLKVRR
jgi:hypothetical protein